MDSGKNQANSSLNEQDEACVRALIFNNSCVLSMVLNTAIELDLFGIIARAGPGAQIYPSQIVVQLKTEDPSVPAWLDRMLRLFVSNSLLTCSMHSLEDGTAERLYGLAPVGKFFVRNEERGSLNGLSGLAGHPANMEVW